MLKFPGRNFICNYQLVGNFQQFFFHTEPSPDWFVGLTGFELCDSNCSWISERKIDLHPYDLGIWEDVNYQVRTLKLKN